MISEPEIVNVRLSPSWSLPVTVPISVSFSSIVKELFEVIWGASLTSTIEIFIVCWEIFKLSLAEIVAEYVDWLSKSGAKLNVKTPFEVMDKSDPLTVKVMSSLSASVAVTVATANSFSLIEKVEDEVNIGLLSFKLFMFTVITWELEFSPSLTETIAEYEEIVS